MRIADFDFPDDLYYDTNHQWIASRDGELIFGLTDYAQSSAGDVVFLDLPVEGVRVRAGQPIGSIESGKWVGRFYAPAAGVVVEANVELRTNPRLINLDPYGRGWIARLRLDPPQDRAGLMRGDDFATFMQEEIARDQLLEESRDA